MEGDRIGVVAIETGATLFLIVGRSKVMQGSVKVRWKEGGRLKYGTAHLDARLVLDGEVWVPVKVARTAERVEFPAWQLEYAGSGPRGGKRWSPLVALAFEPVEEPSGSARWVQPELFGEAA